MVDGQASLRHQFLKVSQAQAESAVPPDAGHDDVRLELSLPEQRWTAGPHGVTLPNSQLQHFRLETLWNAQVTRANDQATRLNASVHNLPTSPTASWPPTIAPTLMV